jgi:pimeloyl-ACP methyl ester carboxylesterase
MDFWRYADVVAGVLDQLGIGAAYWGGQSMGGFTAIRAGIGKADRVKGLILIDTQAHPEDPDRLAQYEAFLQVALEQGVTDDLAGITLLIYFSQTFADKPEGDVWRKKLQASNIPAQHAMIRAVFDRESVHDRLGEIRCPAIVIHGEEDIAIEIERGRELAEVLGAPFVAVPGAGHASPAEEPAIVTRAIDEFLTRQESSG